MMVMQKKVGTITTNCVHFFCSLATRSVPRVCGLPTHIPLLIGEEVFANHELYNVQYGHLVDDETRAFLQDGVNVILRHYKSGKYNVSEARLRRALSLRQRRTIHVPGISPALKKHAYEMCQPESFPRDSRSGVHFARCQCDCFSQARACVTPNAGKMGRVSRHAKRKRSSLLPRGD